MHKTYDGDTLGTTRDTRGFYSLCKQAGDTLGTTRDARGFYSLCKQAGDTYHVQLFAADVATSQPIKIGMKKKMDNTSVLTRYIDS